MKSLQIHAYLRTLIVSALLGLAAISCSQIFEDFELSGEGEVSPSLTIEFEPQAEALTRGTAGNAIKNINSLSIVIYNEDNTLYRIENFAASQLSSVNTDRNSSDKRPIDYDSQGTLSESSTPKVELRLDKIPIDNYRIYAVANMGVLTEAQVSTPEALKALRATWDAANIASNCQMFGYFEQGSNSNCSGYDAPLVPIDYDSMTFHAWLKRLASKVTIVYDGSNLHEDIYVYIQKATIHDIPSTCPLGADNNPASSGDLIADGESIWYNSSGAQLVSNPNLTDYKSWMRIAKGSALKGAVAANGTETVTHPETSTALFFYENLQGEYSSAANKEYYDKCQDPDKVGTPITQPTQPDYKDNIPYGTYIEVEGYYVSNHSPGISQGAIKYRFMLGQDCLYDYDAKRNRHYKLTLKFQGYANQADWHIEYDDEPEIYVPDAFYVSYLYNKKASLPVRVSGAIESLDVEIIRNDWHPYDSTRTNEVPPNTTLSNGDEDFEWNYTVWQNAGNYNTAAAGYRYGRHKVSYINEGTYSGNYTTKNASMNITPPYVGFLSLMAPTGYLDESVELPTTIFCQNGTHWYSDEASMNALQKYYYGTGGDATASNSIPQDHRTLSLSSAGAHESGNDAGRNSYNVTFNGDGSKSVDIPLWTRPYSMILISGFSGNNPYESYQRKAVVSIKGVFTKDGVTKTIVKLVPVYQVRRIINPKAVWRSHDNNDEFHVRLMQRRDPTVSTFEPFVSEGPWKAEIIATNGKDFCELRNASGKTDSKVDFQISFKGVTQADESNCALIRVLYHGYNCEHTIFVRQGYNEPLEIVPGSGKWSSFALYAGQGTFKSTSDNNIGVLTKSPLAIGSYFKRGNYNEAILASNNKTYGKFASVYNKDLKVATAGADGSFTTQSMKWSAIKGVPYDGGTTALPADASYYWRNFKVHTSLGDRTYSLPTMTQCRKLEEDGDVGMGVLYGDGAKETKTTVKEAFGYTDDNNNLNNGDATLNSYGMRGAIAYNASTAAQVFFPIGAEGNGRRTITSLTNPAEPTNGGYLRYAGVDYNLTQAKTEANQYRPVCYNMRNITGAIYWTKDVVTINGTDGYMGWDINFFDLNFAPYDYGIARGNSSTPYGGRYGDAIPIKLVIAE